MSRGERTRRDGRPWLWVVWALAVFVAANVVALVIACSHPPVLVP